VRDIHAVEGRAFAVRGGIRMNAAIHEWQRWVHGVGVFMCGIFMRLKGERREGAFVWSSPRDGGGRAEG
jgi:hypothetical protein